MIFSTCIALPFLNCKVHPEGLGIAMAKIAKYFMLGGLDGAEFNKI